MTLQQLYVVLLTGGVVLLAGIAAARTASRLGLPSLLFFLAVGVVVGEDVLGLDFDDAQLAQALGTAALALILVEGGLTTDWADVKRLLAPAGVLASAGVAVSVGVTATGAHFLLGLEWHLALLLGAIISSTDAAATFAVLRTLPLPRKVTGLLEAESGFNDAPTIILVLVFSNAVTGMPSPAVIVGDILFQLGAGAAVGLAVGRLGAYALRHVALPATGLYPLTAVGFGIVAFAAAGAADASGIIAAYLSGLVLGNAKLPHRAATRSFAEGAGWLAQIGLFVMLGLLVTPSELPSVLLTALGIGLFLLLVARPVSVFLCLAPFRMPLREQAFISWAGLRGAVPIVLATFPVVSGVEGARDLLNIVFVLVVVFTLVQGPTLPVMARLLGVARSGALRDVEVESAPLDVLDADLLTVSVPPGSGLQGVAVFELRLPPPAVVTLVVRDGSSLVPREDTVLRGGDELLLIVSPAVRDAAERRLRAIGRRGKLARWYGEHGDAEPAVDAVAGRR
ncbi:potassium transporter [Streptomyces abyssalis]|uniref:Potassium transporter n=1 Tax=Streptomyces abyssalis TaxID=933944 RepID=A0A1E7JK24_9ACTN|nr:potassium/proton antiporter [Streptomyces abyssalis]OEU85053.1 potassium transporter [Streptomyces abyssalis]OEU87975.1 potassium transporter [Streptomyces abyssalis]